MKTAMMIFMVMMMSAFGSVAQAWDRPHHRYHHHYYHRGYYAPAVRYYSDPYCGPYYYGPSYYYYPRPYYYYRPGFSLRFGW